MTSAGRRTVAFGIGCALLGGMVIGIVDDVIGARAVRIAHDQGYERGHADGRIQGSLDAYRELGIGQPGPPGVPGP